jgi:hypothetical protein
MRIFDVVQPSESMLGVNEASDGYNKLKKKQYSIAHAAR